MKNIALLALVLGLFSAPMTAAAQVAAAPAPNTCPCSDFRFVAKSDKAKAVAAYWEARGKYHVASGLGTMVVMFTALTRQPTNALNDAERSFGEAQDELMSARARAEKLGGLKVLGDRGPDAKVVVALKKGVDYELKNPG